MIESLESGLGPNADSGSGVDAVQERASRDQTNEFNTCETVLKNEKKTTKEDLQFSTNIAVI